jgi:hypothetical protein
MTIAICPDGTRVKFTMTKTPNLGFIEIKPRAKDGTFVKGGGRLYGKIEETNNGIYFIPYDHDNISTYDLAG